MQLTTAFSFELPTRIEYGPGIVEKLTDELAIIGAQKVMLVTDVRLSTTGALARFTRLLAAHRIRYEIFNRVEPNPKDYNVEEGAKKAAFFKPDALVALGGGSPIDCAKAISVVAQQGGRAKDYRNRRITENVLPLIAMPTTAGSGSEVTFSAVITDSGEKFKFSIRDPKIAPRVALVDPEMTLTMPPALTASVGMDVLTHAIEAYTALNSTPLADAAALHAVELVYRHLPTAVADGGNLEARSGMLLASLLAAIAFSHSDVAAAHCLAEALGGLYDLPHGTCNAVALPVVMEYNLDCCEEKYARIARAMGLNFHDARNGSRLAVQAVRQLSRQIAVPDFNSMGVRREDFRTLARHSAANNSNPDNPRPMAEKDYVAILTTLSGSAVEPVP